MVIRIATFTVFTFLLFAVSTASFAFDPVILRSSDVVITTANDRLQESAATQTFDVSTIDPDPVSRATREIISRSHPIKRHSVDRATRDPLRFVRHHPCRKFKKMLMIPTKIFYGNDMILSDKPTSGDLKTIGDQIPTKWLELKHKYGHRHQHDKDEKFETKYEFDGERLNSMTSHHKDKKREHKGGFMRSVRKFLKHTFD